MKVRHILPRFGRIPSDPQMESMSDIVGVAYNLAMQQAARGWEAEDRSERESAAVIQAGYMLDRFKEGNPCLFDVGLCVILCA